MIISERIHEIMSPQELLKHLLAYAKIDFIMNPETENYWLRVYHYDKNWVENGHFLKIDNGSGDHFHILFSPDGCLLKGFAHESDTSPYNLKDGVLLDCIAAHDFYQGAPAPLIAILDDPALDKRLVTFCVWQATGDTAWHFSPSEIPKNWSDGIDTFLGYAHDLNRHCEWFAEYYDAKLDVDVLSRIFRGRPVTAADIASMNPDASPEATLYFLENEF